MLTALIILLGIQIFMSLVLLSTQRNYRQLARLVQERELDQQYQAQQLLAACHEIRSPVTAIQAALDLTRGRLEPAAPTYELGISSPDLEMFARNIARIDSLVDDVLDLTQPSGVASAPIGVDLFEIVHLEASRHPHAQLHERPDQADSTLVATNDPRRLRWAVSNLLTNASEHCRSHIDVRVFLSRMSDDRKAVAVRIADDGSGLGSSASRRGPRVSGFGLRIVQSVIDAHSGELIIEPIAELGGAAFTLILPSDSANTPTMKTDSVTSITAS